jgi:DNA-binding CsgD family transcriptional regulator
LLHREAPVPKAKFNANSVLRRLGGAGPYILYGSLLAAGTLLLTGLDYLRFTRTLSGEFQLVLIASVFLGLGVWAGARLFSRARPLPAFDGNPNARKALGLSPREMDVLALIADGLSNKEIASRLNVSANTVKTHVARVLEKLDVRRRTAALARARELGLLP